MVVPTEHPAVVPNPFEKESYEIVGKQISSATEQVLQEASQSTHTPFSPKLPSTQSTTQLSFSR
jgi:hypothetical protein